MARDEGGTEGTSPAKAAGRQAGQLFDSGWLCGESVLMAVTRAAGIQSPLIPRMATGFCSGLSRTGWLCGAASGAVLALGLVLGRDSRMDPLERSYLPIQGLVRRVLELHGSLNCRDITGVDLGTAEGQTAFKELGIKPRICIPLVEMLAELTCEIIGLGEETEHASGISS